MDRIVLESGVSVKATLSIVFIDLKRLYLIENQSMRIAGSMWQNAALSLRLRIRSSSAEGRTR